MKQQSNQLSNMDLIHLIRKTKYQLDTNNNGIKKKSKLIKQFTNVTKILNKKEVI